MLEIKLTRYSFFAGLVMFQLGKMTSYIADNTLIMLSFIGCSLVLLMVASILYFYSGLKDWSTRCGIHFFLAFITSLVFNIPKGMDFLHGPDLISGIDNLWLVVTPLFIFWAYNIYNAWENFPKTIPK